jgi:hypothetical protein
MEKIYLYIEKSKFSLTTLRAGGIMNPRKRKEGQNGLSKHLPIRHL